MLLTILSFILGLQPLHEMGHRGEGITIAVIDGGFYHANDPAIFDQQKIIGAYDLLEDSLATTDFYESPSEAHGTMCLSTMLYESETFTGTAPDANYILIRTEDTPREYYGEIERLIHGMLLADTLGADIVSISLGYCQFDDESDNYTWDDLNGQSAVSQAATELARRGRLVCVAAGNEGNKPWKYITLPADADSILAVGACSQTGIKAPFSSFGYTTDDRIKPDVMAWGQGTYIYSPQNQRVIQGNGTSFACPEVAGMAASLWSALPQLTAMELRQLIIETANNYDTPNYEYGYGIPDAWEAYKRYATAIHQPETQGETRVRKYIQDGLIIIIRGNAKYDIMGHRIE